MKGLIEVLPNHYIYYNANLHSLVINLIHVCCLTHFDFVGLHDVQLIKFLIKNPPFFCRSVDALQEQNRHVRVVTLVGAATNMSTTNKLGCDYENDEYYLSTKKSSSLSHMMHATSQSSL